MNESSKIPFEPIPIPGLPEMPALPEMPRPSFSRSTTPPAPPPLARRPLLVEDEKPKPLHLPQGISPEAVAPAPTTEAKPTGSALSWLRPSRAKGVVLAGLGSLAIGAFGLNALMPVPVNEPPKAESLAHVELPPMDSKFGFSDKTPKVYEEHPVEEPPALLPRGIGPERNDDLWNKLPALPVQQVENTAPAPIATGLPTIPATVPGVPEVKAEPLQVPVTGVLPPVLLPGFEEKPQPIKLDPTTPEPLPTVKAEPTPLKVDPLPMPAVIPALLPVPELKTHVPVVPESARPNIELKPFQERKPDPLPVSVEAKTDYDVDIHKLRAGDTYAAISQKFYGTANLANALRGYNDNAELTKLRDVQVPPIHIIKRFGAESPRVIPAGVLQEPGLVTPPPIEREVEWGSPGTRKPTGAGGAKSGEPVWR